MTVEEREISLVESPVDDQPRTVEITNARESRPILAAARPSSTHPRSIDTTAAAAAPSAMAAASIVLTRDAAPVLDLAAVRDYGSMRRAAADHANAGTSNGQTAIDSVRAALDEHDRALGLGTDSALVAAIRHAALGSRVPLKSSATLWATAGETG
ncbi:MAG: hypothetical protein JWO86_4289, partial [Myxococcaceae bacterium]|nr:hypothetical protein [Myxococcaceae bacterium]